MQFAVKKNDIKSWDLVPLSGIFADICVARVDGAVIYDARFINTECVGELDAVWGLEIIEEEVFADPETLRGLRLGKAFKALPEQPAVLDRDGFKDNYTLRTLKGADKVLLMGRNAYVKGGR